MPKFDQLVKRLAEAYDYEMPNTNRFDETANDDDVLHYGIKRRSGRYPWGSGEEPYQHAMDFLGRCQALEKTGVSESQLAAALGCYDADGNPSTGVLRMEKRYAQDMRKLDQMDRANTLANRGMGPSAIAKEMGLKNESSARALLNPAAQQRTALAANLAYFLADQVDKKGMIDVGKDVEKELNKRDLSEYDICRELKISKDRLNEALHILEKEGYPTYSGRFDQINNPGKKTTQKVLCPPGTEHKEIFDLSKVNTITDYASPDGGQTFKTFKYPASLDPKRVQVLLRDDINPTDGQKGVDKDGIIQIRRGVPDLSLGDSKFSQVRILVGKDKYLKGMAVYADNMPDGIDVIFNTNKTDPAKTLKTIKDDPENPFGATIKASGQYEYTDPKTGEKKLSPINKCREEGDWSEWSNALPAQFLSKQSTDLAERQLDIAKGQKRDEMDNIMSLTNPTIQKHLLTKFADECDSAAKDLKAAALPGQRYHVMIPCNTLKDNECYAPGYENGTELALVRFPHGGRFEIPVVRVNNRHKPAEALIGKDSIDAICLNKNNAERLSGADFDGDTVMVLPQSKDTKYRVLSRPQLEDLEDFDPQMQYPKREGMIYMKDPVTKVDNTQIEMGKISNLITDMTLLGAGDKDIAKAVKHSMVVIDAGKHQLDYKRSEVENDIQRLKNEWQRTIDPFTGEEKIGGASTIISRSKGETSVLKRTGNPKINMKGTDWYDPSRPEGALIYKNSKLEDVYYPVHSRDPITGLTTIKTMKRGETVVYDRKDPVARAKYDPVLHVDDETGDVYYTSADGSIKYRTKAKLQKSTKMAETDDAKTLMSSMTNPHPMEMLYAEYANYMKSLANEARVNFMTIKENPVSKEAKKEYANEVASLNSKLSDAQLNSIRERAAHRRANVALKEAKNLDPNMTKGDIRKKGQQSLTKARSELNSLTRTERNIEITDREWEAIQKNAISKTTLKAILNNADVDKLRERSMPTETRVLSDVKIRRVKAMAANNNSTIADIANAMGVSVTTIRNILNEDKK